MKKKLVSSLLCLTMLAGCLTGCGGGGNEAGGTNGGTEASGTADEAGDEESTEVQGVSSSAGDENGTKMELWTFVDAHADREMEFFRNRYRGLFEISSALYRDYSKGEDEE